MWDYNQTIRPFISVTFNQQALVEGIKAFDLTPLVLWRVFIFIPLTILQFYRASETYVGIKIVKTLTINFLISKDSS